MADNLVNVGELIFNDIDSNGFLQQLYANLLYNYGVHRLLPEDDRRSLEVDVEAALRFADLLSKSTHPEKRDAHRVWAQEIALLCQILYPNDLHTQAYVPAIFTTLGNYPALGHADSHSSTGLLNDAFNGFQASYLAIPGDPGKKFFAPQKKAFDQFDAAGAFSFSAPTSLGKSFIVRTFIENQVVTGVHNNYAILVPTKALINETRSKLIAELNDELAERNYRIVTASGDVVLEGNHNFIFVLTPERLLYLLISKPDLRLDYVFIDEAHKLSHTESRATFYYQVVSILQNRPSPPRFVFTSPNIPNPEVFLRLINDEKAFDDALATAYSPVTQFKFIVNLDNNSIHGFNHHTDETTPIATFNQPISLLTAIRFIHDSGKTAQTGQTIVFHSSKISAVTSAREFATHMPDLYDDDLEALAKDIERDVHTDYYLAGLIRKGIAYHIGYLPPTIRARVEELYRKRQIEIMFCTNTLLEGVNLPADNLIITKDKIANRQMSAVEFRNLIGRVGRIEYNLYGNVFFLASAQHTDQQTYINMLAKGVDDQKLAIETDPEGLRNIDKQSIVSALREGKVQIETKQRKKYVREMMRKVTLILLRDIQTDRDSLVRREFSAHLDDGDEQTIKAAFAQRTAIQDDDINISVDQTESLQEAIRNGLAFPNQKENGKFDYTETLNFLTNLAAIFKWDIYEDDTLGYKKDGVYTKLRWYTVVLIQWMEGNGLNYVMREALEYQRNHRERFFVANQPQVYMDTIEHRNIVLNDVLQVIEKIILFKLSNYFLRFSNEYKLFHGIDNFPNDWYQYVEYGTTNETSIALQRCGFTHESATYIRRNVSEPLFVLEGQYYLNPALLESPNTNVRKEAEEIKYNIPEAFSMPEFLF